jgi:hypothetical protein
MLKNIPHSITYTDEASIQFAQRSWPIAKGYYEFEGRMHALRIDNQVNLNLSPTYLNGTLAGNQEYLRILGYLIQGDEPVTLSLSNLMDLWLEDQLGHVLL